MIDRMILPFNQISERLGCGCVALFDKDNGITHIKYCSEAHGRRLFMGWDDLVSLSDIEWSLWRMWLEALRDD